MPVIINKEECEGCGTCLSICPKSAIVLKEVDGVIFAEVVSELCDDCGECIEFCLREAIKKGA
jgi:ferredoxin